MKLLPFECTLAVTALEGPCEAELCLDMANHDGLDDIADMIDCLLGLSRWGAFGPEKPQGIAAGASWTSPNVFSERIWRRRLSIAEIDPGFWRVLLQLCVQCHYHLSPIDRLAVRATDGFGNEGDLCALALAIPLPQRFASLPFRSFGNDQPASELIAVRLEVDRPVTDPELDTIRKAFEDWGSAVYCGAFAPVTEPLTGLQLNRVDVARIHATLIECAMMGWNGPRSAFDCLLNLCCGIHYRTVSVVELEIE